MYNDKEHNKTMTTQVLHPQLTVEDLDALIEATDAVIDSHARRSIMNDLTKAALRSIKGGPGGLEDTVKEAKRDHGMMELELAPIKERMALLKAKLILLKREVGREERDKS